MISLHAKTYHQGDAVIRAPWIACRHRDSGYGECRLTGSGSEPQAKRSTISKVKQAEERAGLQSSVPTMPSWPATPQRRRARDTATELAAEQSQGQPCGCHSAGRSRCRYRRARSSQGARRQAGSQPREKTKALAAKEAEVAAKEAQLAERDARITSLSEQLGAANARLNSHPPLGS